MSIGQGSMTEQEFRRFSDLIYQIAGINLHEGKKELLQARVGKIIRLRRISSFAEYFEIVRNDSTGNELVALLDAVSTNLTFFFREEKHFEFLAERWLPAYLARKGAPPRRIRGWSAGCSTGEEPYTILISLLERLGTDASIDLKLMATDLSTRVLEIAQRGVYTEERVRNVPANMRPKYFTKRKDARGETYYQVAEILSERVLFRRLNLMEPLPFRNPLNFIFCRNVMIYFDRETQQNLVARYFEVLEPEGFLFIGHSESLNGIKHPFRYVAPSIYQKP